MFSGASNFVETVDFTFLFILFVSLFFLVLITFLMIYFVIKYNRKRNPRAVNIHGNLSLEILWTVIPTILVLAMFWFGWSGYQQMSEAPADSMVIKAVGQMWQWRFDYGNGITTDTLYVPVDKPVKLDLSSLDVNHAFFIPAFRIKKDVIPGRRNSMWFKANNAGAYDIACAEYCGLRHSYMYTKIIVLPEKDFESWQNLLLMKNNPQMGTNNPDSLTNSK